MESLDSSDNLFMAFVPNNTAFQASFQGEGALGEPACSSLQQPSPSGPTGLSSMAAFPRITCVIHMVLARFCRDCIAALAWRSSSAGMIPIMSIDFNRFQ